MFQPAFPQAPFFPQSSHRFNDNNKNRSRGQGFVSFPRTACQIWGKDNHSARTCCFRNTQASGFTVPPPAFTTPGMVSSPGFYPSYGFPSPNIWRPEYSAQFSVPIPFAQVPSQRPTQPHFLSSGHNNTAGYGGGFNCHFPTSVGPSSSIQSNGYPIGPSSGMQSSGFPSAASAFTACYAPGSGHVTSGNDASVSPNWYLDSGATNHVTSDLNNLTHTQPYPAGVGVMVGNGNSLSVSCSGDGILPTPKAKFHLTNVLHTPAITHNLLSVFQC